MDDPKRGVFWLVDGKLLVCIYDDAATAGLAKSGDNYNHRLLWEHVKPRKCNKPFDYYPRGRVEVSNKGKPIVYPKSRIIHTQNNYVRFIPSLVR